MKTNHNWFEELLRISAYRDITEQLRERHMLSDLEYQKICQRIDAMEDDLIIPENRGPMVRGK